jgi:hypothetical protein
METACAQDLWHSDIRQILQAQCLPNKRERDAPGSVTGDFLTSPMALGQVGL